MKPIDVQKEIKKTLQLVDSLGVIISDILTCDSGQSNDRLEVLRRYSKPKRGLVITDKTEEVNKLLNMMLLPLCTQTLQKIQSQFDFLGDILEVQNRYFIPADFSTGEDVRNSVYFETKDGEIDWNPSFPLNYLETFRNYITRLENISENKKRLTKTLKNPKKAKFVRKKGLLLIDGRECLLPMNLNEYQLCDEMFKQKVREPLSWDIIFEAMTGEEGGNANDWHKVYDAIRAINSRIKKVLHASNLFTWKDKMVRRNY